MAAQRSSDSATFFSEDEKKRIIGAIAEAEKETSGEIRLHLEEHTRENVYQRAMKVFLKIGMQNTAQKNGVLVYLATRDRKFAILGDRGINEVVPDNFWEDVAAKMRGFFLTGDFCEGICEGVVMIGDKLKAYFPYQKDDVNELPDDISFEE